MKQGAIDPKTIIQVVSRAFNAGYKLNNPTKHELQYAIKKEIENALKDLGGESPKIVFITGDDK